MTESKTPSKQCGELISVACAARKKGGESFSTSIGYRFDPDRKIEFSAINMSDFQKSDCFDYSFIRE